MVSIDIKKIAEYTLLSLQQWGIDVSPLKLQKVLYYIQSWHLVYFDSPLFEDCAEAWASGPVYRTVYEVYKETPRNESIVSCFKEEGGFGDKLQKLKEEMSLNADDCEFLDAIYNHYGTMSQDRLVFLTHSERPWNAAREGISPFEFSQNIVTHESQKEYYSSLKKRSEK